jgi:hypothetical protein
LICEWPKRAARALYRALRSLSVLDYAIVAAMALFVFGYGSFA